MLWLSDVVVTVANELRGLIVGLLTGGGIGTMIGHFLEKRRVISDRKFELYSNLIKLLRVTPADPNELREHIRLIHNGISDALLITGSSTVKELLVKVGNSVQDKSYFRDIQKGTKRLNLLLKEMKNELGHKISISSRIFGMFRSDRFSDVGRNERCPCGSGKKFKKCHGA